MPPILSRIPPLAWISDPRCARLERARIPSDINQHHLRHGRCTEWPKAGHTVHIVQKAMGHPHIQTAMRYEHLVPVNLRTLVEEPENHS